MAPPGPAMSALSDLVALLDLERIEDDFFRGHSPAATQVRVFGGQVASQALVAAARTVDFGHVHSLHAYFLRPGDPNIPILYEVDRIRDGRSFSTRRVVAIQNGQAIFNLQASFHVAEPGLDHQIPMPDVPDPESLPDFHTRYAPFRQQLGALYDRPRPIDVRYVDASPIERSGPAAPYQRMWLKADGTLPDDPMLHACLLTYASDLTLLDATLLPHGKRPDAVQMASLDHAMWFHRPFRIDEWVLYDQGTPTSSGSRGLAYGFIYTHRGDLAVSVVQEGLIREVR